MLWLWARLNAGLINEKFRRSAGQKPLSCACGERTQNQRWALTCTHSTTSSLTPPSHTHLWGGRTQGTDWSAAAGALGVCVAVVVCDWSAAAGALGVCVVVVCDWSAAAGALVRAANCVCVTANLLAWC